MTAGIGFNSAPARAPTAEDGEFADNFLLLDSDEKSFDATTSGAVSSEDVFA
jgi:hypothetical protein